MITSFCSSQSRKDFSLGARFLPSHLSVHFLPSSTPRLLTPLLRYPQHRHSKLISTQILVWKKGLRGWKVPTQFQFPTRETAFSAASGQELANNKWPAPVPPWAWVLPRDTLSPPQQEMAPQVQSHSVTQLDTYHSQTKNELQSTSL